MLKECGLQEWYERCDAAVNAVKPIEVFDVSNKYDRECKAVSGGHNFVF